jgi:hypothetical protein
MFFPDLRVSTHPLLLHLHNILSLAHALFAKTTHAHRTWRALIEPTASCEVCWMHLMLWGPWGSASWHAEILLLVSVAFLLCGHVSRFTSAPLGVALLVHATFLVYASLVVHAAPFMIPLVSLCLCLSLLLCLPLCSKRMVLPDGILAT